MQNPVNITVVDAVMGGGKTSAAIRYMERHSQDMRFIFVTPYLDEAKRIKMECPTCDFREPQYASSKLQGLKSLLKEKRNITATHALFGLLDDDAIALLEQGEYVLILDETYSVIRPYVVSAADINLLLDSGTITVAGNGELIWTGGEYRGAFNRLREDIMARSIIMVEQIGPAKYSNKYRFYQVLSTKSFRCFSQIYVLTYLFNGSLLKSYFDYHGFTYSYASIDEPGINAPIKDLIHIWEPQKYCSVGQKENALSYSWFRRKTPKSQQIVELRKNIINFYSNIARTKSAQNLWTTYKQARSLLAGPGYTKGFEAHNARSTNKHRERTSVVYALNKFVDPGIAEFFQMKGIAIDEEHYALSSMLQFIWRSAIRDHKPINLYIPSSRMYRLFTSWLKEVDNVDAAAKAELPPRSK